MLTRSNVATASALCVLGWALLFGLSSCPSGQDDGDASLLIIFGWAGPVSQDPATGELSICIDDGVKNWSCAVSGDAERPEAGTQVIAVCSVRPGATPTVLRFLCPWPQNVF